VVVEYSSNFYRTDRGPVAVSLKCMRPAHGSLRIYLGPSQNVTYKQSEVWPLKCSISVGYKKALTVSNMKTQ